jgi:hypothetical protein
MEPIQGYLEIGIVFYIRLQSFLDDVRARSFCLFGYAVQVIGESFGEPD